MPDLDVTSLDFGAVLRDADKGLVVKPILQNWLHGGNFPDFSIHFEKGDGHRGPDGWFHPSTHPLWPARALYYYLARPDLLLREPMPYANVLSVTLGKALHGFMGFCLREAGYLQTRTDPCICGDPKCEEWGFEDPEVGERGHTDGMAVDEIFEFKTITELSGKVRKAEDMDLEWFKVSWPDYWAQQQSYQRLSGYRQSRVVFFTLGFPWMMKEFVIPFDPHFSYSVAEKYRTVRQAVADQRPPAECCGGQKTCPTRGLCLQ